MADFWNTIGVTLTQFIKGLSEIWEWLNQGLWTWDGITYTPLGLLGVGFGVVIGIIVIKELIW